MGFFEHVPNIAGTLLSSYIARFSKMFPEVEILRCVENCGEPTEFHPQKVCGLERSVSSGAARLKLCKTYRVPLNCRFMDVY
jgi:hypothetical protein